MLSESPVCVCISLMHKKASSDTILRNQTEDIYFELPKLKSSANAGDGLAMPKRMGAEMHELIMVEDRSQLQLERNV